MAKIKLGQRPEFLSFPVTFQLVDGSKDTIRAKFRNRTSKEFAEMIDRIYGAGTGAAEIEKVEGREHSITADAVDRSLDTTARHLGEILVEWDLSDDVNYDNLRRLADEYPSAAAALKIEYRNAVVEGRRGN